MRLTNKALQFSNQIKCWFLEGGENRSTRRKTSRSRVENQQTQPTYDAESGNRTQDTLVEGERSHLCADPAPLTKSQERASKRNVLPHAMCVYFRGLFGQMKCITAVVITFVIWIVSIVTVIPYLVNLRYDYQNETCEENWGSDFSRNAYTLSLFLLDYLFPLIAIIILYVLVWGKLQR